MTEDQVLKLLMLVIDKVAEYDNQELAFEETKNIVESLQDGLGSCRGPYTEELPEDDSEIPRRWRAYGCSDHIHIFNLKFGCFAVGRELAGKMLALGGLP